MKRKQGIKDAKKPENVDFGEVEKGAQMKTKNLMIDTLERKRDLKREKKKRQKEKKKEVKPEGREITEAEQEAVEEFQDADEQNEEKPEEEEKKIYSKPFVQYPTKRAKGMWKGIKTRSKQKNARKDNRTIEQKREKLAGKGIDL